MHSTHTYIGGHVTVANWNWVGIEVVKFADIQAECRGTRGEMGTIKGVGLLGRKCVYSKSYVDIYYGVSIRIRV